MTNYKDSRCTDNDIPDDGAVKYECVSCGTHFRINISPGYCPGCGNPRNEQFGLSIAESNPNITGFIEHE